ncbi:hypothetical protein ES288_A02G165500v1 [Gossypium darwinii]|uniref:Uncharacterized protein n=1 Tax=Gossypium darwinii TaxID=34276 RepID=A0A5D2HFL0_GOSDA|nr:hypothetical protein ES288_A02G165500v1 [Gossypium darwinii]
MVFAFLNRLKKSHFGRRMSLQKCTLVCVTGIHSLKKQLSSSAVYMVASECINLAKKGSTPSLLC